jgi:hypothetical protein
MLRAAVIILLLALAPFEGLLKERNVVVRVGESANLTGVSFLAD